MTLLHVNNLEKDDLLSDVTFSMSAGERVGIIGESGSGKTLTALSIMRLIKTTRGTVHFRERDLQKLSERQLCGIRGKDIAMVFQEPMSALDPLMTVGKQIREAIRIHQKRSRRDAMRQVSGALKEVELDPDLASRFPHELSGGQRQRILIAMALANDPRLLICDEPTTALDATAQRSIVRLILKLTQERNTGLLFISHDLALVAQTCETILVMKAGRIVEKGDSQSIISHPKHEYTKSLINATNLPVARPSEHGRPIITASHLHKKLGPRAILKDIDLQLHRGERLGLVGGSGSGKTTLLRILAGLDQPTQGHVRSDGSTRMVFQDPLGSLDPKMRIREILRESNPLANTEDMEHALSEVGIPGDALLKYPHQFSGGQRQRISIARAVVAQPRILLADEPVSALDVSVRAKVLKMLDTLVEQHSLSMVFVSHDLAVIRSVCDTVAVMHDGKIVEKASTEAIFTRPQHEYTRKLLAAIPQIT
ncbi:ATP-binding cassette domain-containing protein [Corynebacterium gerontici]|uniref:Glutathione import ATP-binding protein GsiA n=1 Tax=Corynebacterium gerontici TaxID=2079234 RepID=A0A3G6J630_9CORY|nr:ABC transporter ATP-binding protein [Corynebacterium gerontici]AZA11910.1 Glutathione import ATP-binding protein GsiA [Corynebacterium gerontici]